MKETTRSLKSAPPSQNNRHWLTYYHAETPDYLIEAKKRLNQIKTFVPPSQQDKRQQETIEAQKNTQQHHQQQVVITSKPPMAMRHWLTYDHPDTPEYMRDARARIGDLRYKKYRSSSSLVYTSIKPHEMSKLIIPTSDQAHEIPMPDLNIQIQSNVEPATVVTVETKSTEPNVEQKVEVVFDKQPTPQPKVDNYFIKQSEFLPDDVNYFDDKVSAEANEWLNGELTMNKQNDLLIKPPTPFKRPVTVSGASQRTQSRASNDKQQRVTPISFDSWMQNANDKDKEIVLDIINKIDGRLSRPISVQSNRSKSISRTQTPQIQFNPRPQTSTKTRKLGKTRISHKFPCAICEKLMVRQELDDMSR